MRTRGWVYQGGYIGVPPCCSPLAVLPGVSWRAGSAAVPTTSQALTGPREPAGTIGQHRAVPPPHAHSPQHSLVLRVQQWAGAGLAVLRCASSGIPVEARRTLVAEIPCRVVQAALWGTQQQGDGAGRCPQRPKALHATSSPPNSQSRGRSQGGRCQSGHCTRRAHSAPSTGRPRCACSQEHSPVGQRKTVSVPWPHMKPAGWAGPGRPDPSTWCARQMRSRSCLCRNLATTSAPKVKETPRSFSPQPCTSLSGSDQSRSHSRPWSGTSVGRMMRRICSIDCRSGDSPAWDRSVSLRRGAASGPRRQPPALCPPPWQQKIFSSTMAAMGKQLKQSVKVFHSLMLYRRLPARQRSRCSQEPFLWAVLHPPHPPVSHTAHGLAVNPPGGWEAVEVAGMGA